MKCRSEAANNLCVRVLFVKMHRQFAGCRTRGKMIPVQVPLALVDPLGCLGLISRITFSKVLFADLSSTPASRAACMERRLCSAWLTGFFLRLVMIESFESYGRVTRGAPQYVGCMLPEG